MSHTVSAEDAGLLLRSKYPRLRVLLAIAVIAIAVLTTTVVAITSNGGTNTSAAARANRRVSSYYPGHCRRTAPAAWCSQP